MQLSIMQQVLLAQLCHLICILSSYVYPTVAAAAPPVITSVRPSQIAPGSSQWLTITGHGFGSSPDELWDARLLQLKSDPNVHDSSAVVVDEVECASRVWLASTEAHCMVPTSLPGAFTYSVQLNVSGVLSATATSLAAAPAADASLIDVDCNLSPLCNSCWLTPPPGANLQSRVDGAWGLSSLDLLIMLCIGAAAVLAALLMAIALVRRKCKRGSSRVGQTSGKDAPPAVAPVPTGVMISYSHANSAFAFRLEKELTAAGFEVWIDSKIVPGEDWRANIAEAIERSFAVVVVLSPTSVTSKYCKEEIYYASQMQRALFPVVCLDAWSALKGGLKMLLQRIQWLQFERNGWDAEFPRLVANLRNAFDRVKAQTAAQTEHNQRRGSVLSRSHSPTSQTKHSDVDDGDEDDEWLRSVSGHVHRLRPVHIDTDDADDEPTGADTQRDTVSTSRVRHISVRSRLPDLSSEVSHAASSAEPADAYVCVDGWSRADQAIAETIRAHLVSHDLHVYVSQHPKLHIVQKKSKKKGQLANVLVHAAHDGRASPSLEYRASPSIESRTRLILDPTVGVNVGSSTPPGSDRLREDGTQTPEPRIGGGSAHEQPSAPGSGGQMRSLGLSRAKSFMGTSSRLLQRSMSLQQMASPEGGVGVPRLIGEDARASPQLRGRRPSVQPVDIIAPTEDLFELNAGHIDASTIMIYIASAVSLKSADCTDELHYAYEVSKPMLVIRTDAHGKEFHAGLLHGSVGMMLQSVSSFHWERDSAEHCQLAALSHTLRHKLAAERRRKREERAAKSKRSSGTNVLTTITVHTALSSKSAVALSSKSQAGMGLASTAVSMGGSSSSGSEQPESSPNAQKMFIPVIAEDNMTNQANSHKPEEQQHPDGSSHAHADGVPSVSVPLPTPMSTEASIDMASPRSARHVLLNMGSAIEPSSADARDDTSNNATLVSQPRSPVAPFQSAVPSATSHMHTATPAAHDSSVHTHHRRTASSRVAPSSRVPLDSPVRLAQAQQLSPRGVSSVRADANTYTSITHTQPPTSPRSPRARRTQPALGINTAISIDSAERTTLPVSSPSELTAPSQLSPTVSLSPSPSAIVSSSSVPVLVSVPVSPSSPRHITSTPRRITATHNTTGTSMTTNIDGSTAVAPLIAPTARRRTGTTAAHATAAPVTSNDIHTTSNPISPRTRAKVSTADRNSAGNINTSTSYSQSQAESSTHSTSISSVPMSSSIAAQLNSPNSNRKVILRNTRTSGLSLSTAGDHIVTGRRITHHTHTDAPSTTAAAAAASHTTLQSAFNTDAPV